MQSHKTNESKKTGKVATRNEIKEARNGLSRKAFLKQATGTAGMVAFAGSGLVSFLGCTSTKGSEQIVQQVDELISKMTVKEKVSQLRYDAPAIERLNIPQHNWWNECLHGVARAGLATVFPQAIGMAASWNGPLFEEVATAISDEARAKHEAFVRRGLRKIYMGLTFWSPNINLVRDPRWGRGQETYGEDPYLTGKLAVNFIKGLQGDDEENTKIVATAKHFAVYSGPEPLRHSMDVNVSPQDFYETYLPMFKRCIDEGKVKSVMCAYNSLEGEPCCSNDPLLHDILRNDWQFDGYVVSDCWAVKDIYEEEAHNVAANAAEASAMALKSGTDLNCGSSYRDLDIAVEQGLVGEKVLDQSLRRLFQARYRLGMIDGEETGPYTGIPYSVVSSAEHQKLARKLARESIVLLKNEVPNDGPEPLLPLSKEIKKLAVIGPNADDHWVMLGNYHGTPDHVITPLKGIRDKVGSNTEVLYAQGCDIADEWPSLTVIPSEYLIPAKGDGQGLYAEYYGNRSFEGTSAIQRVDDTVNFAWKDDTPVSGELADTFSVRWTGAITPPKTGTYTLGFKGKNAFKLYLNNELTFEIDSVHDALEERVELDLEAGQTYDLKIEYINYGADPQAHLYWCMPDRQLEANAMAAARQADAVVLCMGLSSSLEGEEMPVKIEGFNKGDKTNLQLPSAQIRLMKKLNALGKPMVLVLMTGSAVTFPWAQQHIPAIVQAWYGGEAGGAALADVLFGDYNPAGRLPVTFYKSIEQVPSFTDYSMDNRTYKYFEDTPLYPFGYGLSYTRFGYSNLKVPAELKAGEPLTVTVSVTNTGHRKGDEVIQLYVSHPEVKMRKPIRTLQAFKRVTLKEGQTHEVTFELEPSQLMLIDESGEQIPPTGQLTISVGGKQPGFTGRPDAQTTEVVKETVNII